MHLGYIGFAPHIDTIDIAEQERSVAKVAHSKQQSCATNTSSEIFRNNCMPLYQFSRSTN